MTKKILKDELLFHSVHGLCRVAGITRDSYSLRPVVQSRSNARFTVPGDLLESSGFNRMVSVKEADEILEYFKTGEKRKSAEGTAWTMAVALRAEARSKEVSKDKRKSQQLAQLVRSLANELAIVQQSNLQDTLLKMREKFEPVSKINPLVLATLTNVMDII